MFSIFKKETRVLEAPIQKKSVNQVIEEIHESFYTEVDKLLAEAKISKSLDTDKKDLIDKCKKLKQLGFSKSAEVIEGEKEIVRLNEINRENANKRDLVEAINYFSFKYPHYKFITEDSVKKICQKYNLIYGPVSKYIGTVPDKNLEHIEKFKIKKEDELLLAEKDRWNGGRIEYTNHENKKSEEDYLDSLMKKDTSNFTFYARRRKTYSEAPLEIAAPVKDFDTEGMELKNFKLSKIEIPDPVVLKPVFYKGSKYYLIITAWGLEANDELVVNPRNN